MRRWADLAVVGSERQLCATSRHSPLRSRNRNGAHRDAGGGAVHSIIIGPSVSARTMVLAD